MSELETEKAGLTEAERTRIWQLARAGKDVTLANEVERIIASRLAEVS